MSAVHDAPRTSIELAHRDRQIAYARAAGWGWAEIAEHFGLSERQCKRAAKGFVIGASRLAGLSDPDPLRGRP
jgi:hypothetical protein